MKSINTTAEPTLAVDSWVHWVGPHVRCTRQNVTLHCLQHVLTGELTLEAQRFDIERKDLEEIVMHDAVIPRQIKSDR